MIIEYLAPGRIPSLNVRGDLPLKPGVIYKAFTGLSTGFPFPFLTCVVRASAEAWKYGVEVKRLEYGEHGELIIYFSVLETLRMDQTPVTFELIDESLMVEEFMIETGPKLPPPGLKIALEPASARRLGERPAAAPGAALKPQLSEADAAKKAADWLNSPDDKGRVVSGNDQVALHPVERPATVTAGVAPKNMKSNLSRGVVTAPLRAGIAPSAASGFQAQPSVDGGQPMRTSDLKEEFTVLKPQEERLADRVSDTLPDPHLEALSGSDPASAIAGL